MDSTTHNLREQVMINQFISASGCERDHAQSLLINSNWNLERALSMFFSETTHGHYNSNHILQNTPATPDNFGDILQQINNFKLNGQNNSLNSNTSTSSPNTNNLDKNISPLVNHIYHHNFNTSSNLVRNMK